MLNSTAAIELSHVRKQFGQSIALHDVSLAIKDREFFTLLGPSGCGKTTLLRIIAGFESVTEGTVKLHGEEIAALPANKRSVNTVFQHYSLFPHMSVEENILFGLQMRKVANHNAHKRVKTMLDLVQLGEYADRLPSQLSGGQQQRVALARALAPEPEVLLLDEPLSALDLKLRQAMRVELKQIQEEAGITFIFVTHDQEEALTLSDRIAVMSEGAVQQVGHPEAIYQHPDNQFVAEFIGESNLFKCTVVGQGSETLQCRLDNGPTIEASRPPTEQSIDVGQHGLLLVRPERLKICTLNDTNCLQGKINRLVYLGTDTQLVVALESGQNLIVRAQNSEEKTGLPAVGESLALRIDEGSARFLV